MTAESAELSPKIPSHASRASAMPPSDAQSSPRKQYCSLPPPTVSPHVVRPRWPSALQIPSAVRIVEVGPRDGLQNENPIVDTHLKIALVHDLVDAGLRSIEVTAFVSPKRVPQLADSSAVMQAIQKKSGVSYSALVPNMKGLKAALAAGAEEIAIFASATEQFSMHNVNCTIKQSLDTFKKVTATALAHGLKVRGYVSCVVGCPYEGSVDPKAAANVAAALWNMGCYEISLGDTIGVGNPKSIVRLIHAVLSRGIPVSALAIHCHDTRGTALANVLAALSAGVSVVDSSVAGLGGCPFAQGATGNLATEDLVCMLQGMDIDVGPIDLDKLIDVGRRICTYLKRENSSHVALAKACSPNAQVSHRNSS